MTCGIYRIYNKVNGKSYIGQSKNVEKRLRDHFRGLNNGNHYNHYLQSAFLFHGAENFEHQLIEACEEEALTQREEYWIDAALYYAGVYNLVRPEDNKKVSVETRRKISEAGKRRTHTEETRRKLCEAGKRRTHTEETRHKISESQKGRVLSEEARHKLSEAGKVKMIGNQNAKGYTHTEEAHRKMSEAAKERWRKRKEENK